MKNDLIERMRRDWDSRAAEDSKYFIACQRRHQDDAEFAQGAPDVLARIRRDYLYLPAASVQSKGDFGLDASPGERRFLEIGCGIGRLMLPLAAECGEIHGVDISTEMIALGRKQLEHLPNAHFQAAQNDLAMFQDAWFDLVYSYAVFQHIPDKGLVYRYVDEAFRVLKPGGIFIGQFSGAPPFEERNDTWVGASFQEKELLRDVSAKGWQVVSSEGAGTQYLWLTMRKPAPASRPKSPFDWTPATTPSPDGWTVKITAVLNPSDQPELTAGGLEGFAIIYLENLFDDCANLPDLSVRIGTELAEVKYVGPNLPGNWRQINAYLPETIPPGSQQVVLFWKGRQVSNAFDVNVRLRPPLQPRLITITDGEEIALQGVSKCGKLQLNLDGCRDIRTLRITVGGRSPEKIEVFMVEPLTRRFQVNAPVPKGLSGRQAVRVWIDGQELPPQEVEV